MDLLKLLFNLAAILAFLGILGTASWLIYRRRYRRVGPDEALIIYGSKAKEDKDGYRVIVGGGSFVRPFIEQAELFPTHAMQLDIELRGVLAGKQRTPVNVNATATVKVPVGPDQRSVGYPAAGKAASNFLGMSVDEIRDALSKVVAGHLRNIVAGLEAVELYENQAQFAEDLKAKAGAEMEQLGYTFLSAVFESITDDAGYLESLGVPEIERARKDARIAQANNDEAATLREEEVRLAKERQRISVERDIAQSNKDLELERAAIQQETDVAAAKAVKAGELAAKTEDIRIAELEADRQKKELDATVREKAEAEKYAKERAAEAARFAAEQEAEARKFAEEQAAESDRIKRDKASEAAEREAEAERVRRAKAAEALRLEAEAEATREREVGLARAEAVKAQGEAEAEARRLLAEALQAYSEAGVSLEALKLMPDIVAAAAEPLARAGNTTIISNGGDGGGTGTSKLTQDVMEVLTTTLPVVKNLSGVDLEKVMRQAVDMVTTEDDEDRTPALNGSGAADQPWTDGE